MGATTERLWFPRARRLRTQRSFRRVFDARCAASDSRIIVHACRNDGRPMRLGVVVGRRYGTAVRRNRFKRLVREAFRQGQRQWPAGYDIVVRPKPNGGEPVFDDVARSLAELIPAAVGSLARRRH